MTSRRDFLKTSAVISATTGVPIVAAATKAGETEKAAQTASQLAAATVATLPPPIDPTRPAPTQSPAGKNMVTARLDNRLLQKIERFFDGTQKTVIIELLQNARRAGATKIKITNHQLSSTRWRVTLEDDGEGIPDLGALLLCGFSGWDDEIEAAEDPAGAGFFCLAPRAVTAESRGKKIEITEKGQWLGLPCAITASDFTQRGTRLTFETTEEWNDKSIRGAAKFFPLPIEIVATDGKTDTLLPLQFFDDPQRVEAGPITHVKELGIRIQITKRHVGDTRLNFHGLLIPDIYDFTTEKLLEAAYRGALVEMTGEPTRLALVLPAREKLRDDTYKMKLLNAVRRAIYEDLATTDRPHKLTRCQFNAAIAAGFTLREATPKFQRAMGDWHRAPRNVWLDSASDDESAPPRPLAAAEVASWAAFNADLLAIDQVADFSAVTIPDGYDGYSWADSVPRITACAYLFGEELYRTDVVFPYARRTFRIVESIKLKLKIKDGKPRVYDSRIARNGRDVYITKDLLLDCSSGRDNESQLIYSACFSADCDNDPRASGLRNRVFNRAIEECQTFFEGEFESLRRELAEVAGRIRAKMRQRLSNVPWRGVEIGSDVSDEITVRQDTARYTVSCTGHVTRHTA